MPHRGHAQPDRGGQDNIAIAIEICGCVLEGMPNLTDGGQYPSRLPVICGCILEGMPHLTGGGQDNVAVAIGICGCVLEGMPI